MPSYNSNAKSVIKNLIKQFEGIDENVISPLVRSIAADVAASNVRRIHNDGKAVDGSKIGDYSESYKKVRQNPKSGSARQTQYVDLSFTGTLSKEFQPVEENKISGEFILGPNEIGVGFISAYGANLSEVLEEKYNKKIWGVTQEDERIAQEEFITRLHKYLNG